MLSTPTPFPQQGSNALLGRVLVRIIQPTPDGNALISGERSPGRHFTATVPIADLSDATPPEHPIDRWIDERLTKSSGVYPTTASDLHRDFTAWCLDRRLDSHSVPSPRVLHAQLRERGFVGRMAIKGRPTGPMSVLCFDALLRPLAAVA